MHRLRTLQVVSFALLFSALPLVLAGCPDGPGVAIGRQSVPDDAADAEGSVEGGDESDASVADGDADGSPQGTGALCGVSGKDECGSLLLCAAGLGCVECRSDDDCPLAAGRCLEGTCVGCRPLGAGGATMSDCPSAATACSTATYECQARCSSSGGAPPCPAGTACDNLTGQCVGCTTGADCPTGVCSAPRRTCVECIDDATCPASRPRCRRLTGDCVKCTSDADCGHAAPVCDPRTFTCRVDLSVDASP